MKVRMFGALRKYSDTDGMVQFHMDGPMTVSKFKTALRSQLMVEYVGFDDAVFNQSVIANQDEILRDEELIKEHDQVAILPPVCGG